MAREGWTFFFARWTMMGRLRAKRFGIVAEGAEHDRPGAETVPSGEQSAAPVMDRDERVEREENVLMAVFAVARAEELPLRFSGVRALDVEQDVPVHLGQRR